MIQKIHLWAYIQRKTWFPGICAPQCSLQHYLQRANTQKQHKCPFTEEWIKMWYLYMYHSAIKKNEIVPFVATWLNLEVIILSEVSHKETNI